MSESITVVRPYAKTAFDFTAEHQSAERWQDMLTFATEITENEQMAELPSGVFTSETLAESSIAVCGERLDENGQSLIRIVVEGGRLDVLPDVLEQFTHLYTVNEATTEADVISAVAPSEQQLARISATTEKRLSRKVKLNYKVDESVMVDAIIWAGNMVADSSVRGRLKCLVDVLQS